jgi:hypothetical protein
MLALGERITRTMSQEAFTSVLAAVPMAIGMSLLLK